MQLPLRFSECSKMFKWAFRPRLQHTRYQILEYGANTNQYFQGGISDNSLSWTTHCNQGHKMVGLLEIEGRGDLWKVFFEGSYAVIAPVPGE